VTLALRVEHAVIARRTRRAHGSRLSEQKTTDVGTARIRYREAGEGPLVVFVCDPPVTVEAYDDVVATLAPCHRVVVAELPGFGFSAPAAGFDFRFGTVNDAVAAFLSATRRDAEPVTLVAPCAAAYTGLDVATRRPGLVDHLVVTQAPSWEQELAWRDRLARPGRGVMMRPVLGQALVAARHPRVATSWVRYASGSAAVGEELARHAAAAARDGALFSLASFGQAWFGGPAPVVDLGATRVTALWGEADRSHRRSDPDSLRALVPGVDVRRVTGAGHFVELERPDLIQEVLDRQA